MYFNLAYKNVKKSYKDYFVYFITLTISVALFYLFNSFDAQQQILALDPEQSFGFKSLTAAMGVLSYFVTFVFGFLILYANNFIMRRRKQEIALYTLLGMKKSRVSRIMLYETVLVGLLSLVSGIALGIVLSQGVAAFTGYLLSVSINYRFIVSMNAVIMTLINFSLIFVIVGIFNNILMSRAKLIDLFKARSTNEKIVADHPILMTIILLISIGVLAYTYYFVLQPMMLLKYLFPVLAVGSLATYGLFYGLSYWFVRLSQSLKKYYYRDLNAFSTRQISSKISSTYKLLASVSLMLLLSFGSLATAFNVNSIVNRMFNQETMYDYNIEFGVLPGIDYDLVQKHQLDEKYDLHVSNLYNTGYSTENLLDDLYLDNGDNILNQFYFHVNLLDVDDYNFYIEREKKEVLELKDDEIVYFIPEGFYMLSEDGDKQLLNDTITIANKQLTVLNHEDHSSNMGSTLTYDGLNVVANAKTIDSLKTAINSVLTEDDLAYNRQMININFKEGQNEHVESKALTEMMRNMENIEGLMNLSYDSKSQNLAQAQQMTLLLTYLGLYLGLTFIVVCVMVISLQLLSEASDNYERYLLLDKIGVTHKVQRHSIFKQNLIYFGLPLFIALIHSIVGIKAVNDTMAFGGLVTKSYNGIFLGVGILVLIYIIYFLVTYFSSVRMIFDRKN